MSRYIDADTLKPDYYDEYVVGDDEYVVRYYSETQIDNAPSIDIEPKRGEWIDKGWKGDWQFETDGRGNCWRVFECSLCNGENIRKTHFCPNCGARMKGADNEH